MSATPLPATMEDLLQQLTPLVEALVNGILDRVIQDLDVRQLTWRFEPGHIVSVSGEVCEFEPASDPGTTQHATRVGGALPDVDDTALVALGPKGQAWAISVVASPA